MEVYPRACGGTAEECRSVRDSERLSPRVRGNRIPQGLSKGRSRSIPARAGEPLAYLELQRSIKVYPRACGGTTCRQIHMYCYVGLSPRVRGNQYLQIVRDTNQRSIPARAGEPSLRQPPVPARTVYPRACGGTLIKPSQPQTVPGLSPRVRGNRNIGYAARLGSRSIPARAGEPTRRTLRRTGAQVYPRACGGTSTCSVRPSMRTGLSPRVRGNLQQLGQELGRWRSIPARAGEPALQTRRASLASVYPRACGGTSLTSETTVSGEGLSPRVRGNHDCALATALQGHSIPARAGEPPPPTRAVTLRMVYPRACGGTRGN